MIESQKIDVKEVKKPFQLLAAWLVGLVLIDGIFLGVSTQISGWLQSLLVITSVINVPLFLIAIFILQTRFRPEMQDDVFYSRYLDSKTNEVIQVTLREIIQLEFNSIRTELRDIKNANQIAVEKTKTTTLHQEQELGYRWKIGVNDYLDNYTKIRSILKREKIPVNNIFGSATTKDHPENKIISISPRISFNAKTTLIKLGFEMGMEGYSFFDNVIEDIDEPILIGAYGKESYVPITNALIDEINNEIEPVDLKQIEKNYLALTIK